jgi:hypothetical protein
MKPKELRIGNWVLFKNNHVKIDVSDFAQLYYDDDYFKKISGIQLNEEWWDRFGFEWNLKHCTYANDLIYFTRWKMPIYLLNNNESQRIELKYVHQLQNLHFALTGEELEIEMKDTAIEISRFGINDAVNIRNRPISRFKKGIES